MSKSLVSIILAVLFIAETGYAGRIRNRKVKEAPKACKEMAEDTMLSRQGKVVFGTLRHSLLIEEDLNEGETKSTTVSLVKDKGEKICQWTEEQWNQILAENKIDKITRFSFFVDEFKEMLYPFVKRDDNSFLIMKVPFSTCGLEEKSTLAKLELPKCEAPKKSKHKRSRKSSIAKK